MIIQYYCYRQHFMFPLYVGFTTDNSILDIGKFSCTECEWIVPNTMDE